MTQTHTGVVTATPIKGRLLPPVSALGKAPKFTFRTHQSRRDRDWQYQVVATASQLVITGRGGYVNQNQAAAAAERWIAAHS